VKISSMATKWAAPWRSGVINDASNWEIAAVFAGARGGVATKLLDSDLSKARTAVS
jgi:hypothetical protein